MDVEKVMNEVQLQEISSTRRHLYCISRKQDVGTARHDDSLESYGAITSIKPNL
jgi:hypothetical protein